MTYSIYLIDEIGNVCFYECEIDDVNERVEEYLSECRNILHSNCDDVSFWLNERKLDEGILSANFCATVYDERKTLQFIIHDLDIEQNGIEDIVSMFDEFANSV